MFIFLKDGRRYYINSLYGVETTRNSIVLNFIEVDNGVTIKRIVEIPEELVESIFDNKEGIS